MVNKPVNKKPSPKQGGADKKPKAAAKAGGAVKKADIKKPRFTKKVSDLKMED